MRKILTTYEKDSERNSSGDPRISSERNPKQISFGKMQGNFGKNLVKDSDSNTGNFMGNPSQFRNSRRFSRMNPGNNHSNLEKVLVGIQKKAPGGVQKNNLEGNPGRTFIIPREIRDFYKENSSRQLSEINEKHIGETSEEITVINPAENS